MRTWSEEAFASEVSRCIVTPALYLHPTICNDECQVPDIGQSEMAVPHSANPCRCLCPSRVSPFGRERPPFSTAGGWIPDIAGMAG